MMDNKNIIFKVPLVIFRGEVKTNHNHVTLCRFRGRTHVQFVARACANIAECDAKPNLDVASCEGYGGESKQALDQIARDHSSRQLPLLAVAVSEQSQYFEVVRDR